MSNVRSTMTRAAVVAALAGGMVGTPVPARAAAAPVASGALGSVDVVVGGQAAPQEPVSRCAVDGRTRNSSDGTLVGRHTSYGRGETTCGRDAEGTAFARVSGQRFETTVLRRFGGPTLTVGTYSARCDTTGTGSAGGIELGGVSGFTVPRDIPTNHAILVPGRAAGDPPMARIVVNELVVPTPADGSMTTNTVRITLFPEGGPASGDIVVGSASCDPYP
ncbi:hypothetical protein SAMN05421810_102127 [Amycolatopsis arida]|uniref:Neocarzinostatin family protein n=1 Tax=Amycolatopsis arida TaxID=587909 RepID=A0A1I5P343_9PSEU|nr:hypothetical protein [Amycolatopsis arida]TDX98335.1 hypothetical protein CLV69_101127 [Amycolatopsis arida]SFP28383.1 hypothetical protein SAMN05421810_102127 [Amycolatopsis arida]